jgi:hypothetical protein
MLKKVIFAAALALSFFGSVRLVGSDSQIPFTLSNSANACDDPFDCGTTWPR